MMAYDVDGVEMMAGGSIPVNERKAYRTHSDMVGRTSAGVLVANYPVDSVVRHQIFPPTPKGTITANVEVVYVLKDIPVMKRKCQINLAPDKSEASIRNNSEFFACLSGKIDEEHITITREQFDVLKKIWE